MLSLAFLLHCCLSSGVGVLMLFFPDDLRDYFCEPTVRKCEKLSGCGTKECMRARHGVCLYARHHTSMFCLNRARTVAVRHCWRVPRRTGIPQPHGQDA